MFSAAAVESPKVVFLVLILVTGDCYIMAACSPRYTAFCAFAKKEYSNISLLAIREHVCHFIDLSYVLRSKVFQAGRDSVPCRSVVPDRIAV